MVDMVYWLLGDPNMDAWGRMGPIHPTLNIPMDITISLQSASGAMVPGSTRACLVIVLLLSLRSRGLCSCEGGFQVRIEAAEIFLDFGVLHHIEGSEGRQRFHGEELGVQMDRAQKII